MFRWSGIDEFNIEDSDELESLIPSSLFIGDQWGVEVSSGGLDEVDSEVIDTELYPKRDVDHVLLSKEQEYKLGLRLQKAFSTLQKVLCKKSEQLAVLVEWVANENDAEHNNGARDNIITLNDEMQVYAHLALTHVVFQEKYFEVKQELIDAIAAFDFDRDLILSLAQESAKQYAGEHFSSQLESVLDNVYELRNQFVKTNVRLVYHVARRHIGKGISLEDMVQEGVFGLMRAALKFDPELNIKFSTYAFWWVKQSIRQAIAKQRSLIRYPVHVNDQVNKVYGFRQDYLKSHGKLPSNKTCEKALKMSTKQVKDILSLTNLCVSADSPVHVDSKRCILDDLTSESVVRPVEAMQQLSDNELVQYYLSCLSDRERKVILMRYGIGMTKSYSLNEIAPQIGVSRERIRQISEEAIAKIRSQLNSQQDLD